MSTGRNVQNRIMAIFDHFRNTHARYLETAIFTSKNYQFYAAVANTPNEAIKLIEAGFDYITGEYNDGGKLFRKRK